MEKEFRFEFSEEGKEDFLSKIKETIVFEYFSLPEKAKEKNILLQEIMRMLDDGISLEELAEIQSLCVYSDEEHDLTKIAKLCLQLVFQDFLKDYRKKARSMKKDMNYNEAFEAAVKEIIRYLNAERSDFPESTLKCLYLLTDEDIDSHNQRITAQQIMLQCLPFCNTIAKTEDLEEKVFGAMM